MLNRQRSFLLTAGVRGQALTEFALVFPLFVMVLIGIIVLGLGVFNQQQINNAAREAARYAITHTATSQCPTVSNRPPDPSLLPAPNSYFPCDNPAEHWPRMTAHMRGKLFGVPQSRVQMTACWSGYWTRDTLGNWASYDQISTDPSTGGTNEFRECTVEVYGWCPDQSGPSTRHTINPRTGHDPTCPPAVPPEPPLVRLDCSKEFPNTSSTNDMASSYAASNAANANQVTVLTCYDWAPPLAGFLLIPDKVAVQAVITEALEYQQ